MALQFTLQVCSSFYRKIGRDSQSAAFQRLISIASQIQQCKQDSNGPSSSPPPKALHPECNEHVLVDAQHSLTLTDGNRSDSHGIDSHVSCDDDEAFWSQAVDAMDERAWEGDGEKEMEGRGNVEQRNERGQEGDDGGDSAFIDELLSSGLIVTPQESTTDTRSHRANHSTPCTSHDQDHSTLPCHPTTPLSHRHAVSGKANPHHLF